MHQCVLILLDDSPIAKLLFLAAIATPPSADAVVLTRLCFLGLVGECQFLCHLIIPYFHLTLSLQFAIQLLLSYCLCRGFLKCCRVMVGEQRIHQIFSLNHHGRSTRESCGNNR